MIVQIFININGKSSVFLFDKGSKPNNEIKNDLFQFIEDKINIHKIYFRITNSGKSYRWLDNVDMEFYNNSTYYFHCVNKLTEIKLNDSDIYYINPEIIYESEVLKSMDDDDMLCLSAKDIVNKKVLENWLVMSFYLKKFKKCNYFYKTLVLQKPLPNNYLEKIIGDEAFAYLDSLSLEELKSLATFSDYIFISYLLEIVCAFIANKYVKNKNIDDIKKLNLI